MVSHTAQPKNRPPAELLKLTDELIRCSYVLLFNKFPDTRLGNIKEALFESVDRMATGERAHLGMFLPSEEIIFHLDGAD